MRKLMIDIHDHIRYHKGAYTWVVFKWSDSIRDFFLPIHHDEKKGLERNGMRSWDFILPVIYGVSCHGNLGNFLRPYLFPPVGHGFPQKVVVFGESGPQNGERNIQVKDLYCPEI